MAKLVKMESTESSHYYTTRKNEKKQEKMELMKYDPILRRHVKYKESKIKS